MFYLGIILVAVGTLIGVINFFGTLYIANRDNTYEGSVPLVVTFGATAAAIIAVVTLLHGAVVDDPDLPVVGGVILESIDAAWYRITWWGLGHMSQQVNVCAMVSVWYLLGTLSVGAKPINQAVCRGAFVLYILFINLASAHHILVDPGVGAAWKIWNTSYAMYLAVLASMIHGFTVPASIEVAMRKKGYNRGPLRLALLGAVAQPGLLGLLPVAGDLRLRRRHHRRRAGHPADQHHGPQHAAHPGTLPRHRGGRHHPGLHGPHLLRGALDLPEGVLRQGALPDPALDLFGGGITVMAALGMSFAGSYGVPRRHWDVDMTGGSQLFHGLRLRRSM